MVVPTDLQVRLERFAARVLPLRACTVSTGVERCQRKCTRARFLAVSRTLELSTRFLPEATLERKFRVRSWAGDGRRRRRGRAGHRGPLLLLLLRRRLETAGRGALGQAQVEGRRGGRTRVGEHGSGGDPLRRQALGAAEVQRRAVAQRQRPAAI